MDWLEEQTLVLDIEVAFAALYTQNVFHLFV